MKFLALLAAGTLGLATQLTAETELITNDKFADGGATWALKAAPDASATMSIAEDGADKVLFIEVSEPPQDKDPAPDVRLHRLFGEVTTDKEYKVSFKAKAEQPTKVISFIYPENEGSRVLWRVEVALDSDWKEFNYTFKGRDTADNCVFGFSNLGKAANKYYFKDVVLSSD